ncbi:hypothetical protein KA082_00980 [Candidatus Woesebacteria bacterium]|nr:hypothetical protein [Candidatus Woesebacteria bacterium]
MPQNSELKTKDPSQPDRASDRLFRLLPNPLRIAIISGLIGPMVACAPDTQSVATAAALEVATRTPTATPTATVSPESTKVNKDPDQIAQAAIKATATPESVVLKATATPEPTGSPEANVAVVDKIEILASQLNIRDKEGDKTGEILVEGQIAHVELEAGDTGRYILLAVYDPATKQFVDRANQYISANEQFSRSLGRVEIPATPEPGVGETGTGGAVTTSEQVTTTGESATAIGGYAEAAALVENDTRYEHAFDPEKIVKTMAVLNADGTGENRPVNMTKDGVYSVDDAGNLQWTLFDGVKYVWMNSNPESRSKVWAREYVSTTKAKIYFDANYNLPPEGDELRYYEGNNYDYSAAYNPRLSTVNEFQGMFQDPIILKIADNTDGYKDYAIADEMYDETTAIDAASPEFNALVEQRFNKIITDAISRTISTGEDVVQNSDGTYSVVLKINKNKPDGTPGEIIRGNLNPNIPIKFVFSRSAKNGKFDGKGTSDSISTNFAKDPISIDSNGGLVFHLESVSDDNFSIAATLRTLFMLLMTNNRVPHTPADDKIIARLAEGVNNSGAEGYGVSSFYITVKVGEMYYIMPLLTANMAYNGSPQTSSNLIPNAK